MTCKKQTLVQKVFAEVISYGGIAGTRAQVFDHAFQVCLSRLGENEPNRQQRARLGAEQFAFGSRAVALSAADAACHIQWDRALAEGIL